MGDDLFDQIVEDAIAEETRREESEATEAEAGASEEDDIEVDDELLALDDSADANDESENASASSFALNAPSDSPSHEQPPKPNKPAAKPKAGNEPKAGDSKVGDSAIDGKGAGKNTLPLSTGPFANRDYQVVGTLSLVSARRVIGTGGWSADEGRSAEGEKAIASAERELKMELRAQAAKRGGHAVVDVSIQLAAAGNGLLVMQATGTPVRLKKRPEKS